jgi:hypothetical protein
MRGQRFLGAPPVLSLFLQGEGAIADFDDSVFAGESTAEEMKNPMTAHSRRAFFMIRSFLVRSDPQSCHSIYRSLARDRSSLRAHWRILN